MQAGWVPALTATFLILAALWLGGAPFDLPDRDTPEIELFGPRGDLDRFPEQFEWRRVEGAEFYDVSVIHVPRPDGAQGTLVFRQRGVTNVLRVSFGEETLPPWGEFRWEVQAYRANRVLAAGLGSFRVVTPPTIPD
jgi:hypothetical protein